MKRSFSFLLTLSLLLLIGCAEEQEIKEVNEEILPERNSLIQWEFFNEEAFHNFSFPLWFNAPLVDDQDVKKIKISVYQYRGSGDLKQQKDTVPDEIWEFQFTKEGWVKDISLHEYQESILIASYNFNYASSLDSLGYVAPSFSTLHNFSTQKNKVQQILDQVEELQLFKRLVFESQDSVSATYSNALSALEERHIFILDSSNFNVRFIDQYYEANGKHYYYYGVPRHYFESFKLTNLVEKTIEQRRTYYPNGVIKTQAFHNGGFFTARHFTYGESGECTGYIDSLFSDGDAFINEQYSTIDYREGLPIQVQRFNSHDSLKERPQQTYLLKYSHFE